MGSINVAPQVVFAGVHNGIHAQIYYAQNQGWIAVDYPQNSSNILFYSQLGMFLCSGNEDLYQTVELARGAGLGCEK